MFQIFTDVSEEFATFTFREEEYGKDRKMLLTQGEEISVPGQISRRTWNMKRIQGP
jgi:hypothetical protein